MEGTKNADVIYTDVWVSMGEPDEVWEDRIKQLKPYQVNADIMKNANEFKSTYDILDELAEKWSSLTDIQQASVTELIAGGQNLASIYRNINNRTYLIARAA